MLIGTGDTLHEAVARVTSTGRGDVVDELRDVAVRLERGATAAAAFRSWSADARCPHVAQLTADVRGCTSADDLVAVLDRNTVALLRHVHRRHLRLVRWRATVVWVGALAALAGTVAVVV
jgi:hypothetical protein